MVFEGMTKKQWLGILLIIIVVTVFRTMVQPFIPSDGSSPFPPSAIVQASLLPVAFVIYGFIMLGLLALVFVLIQGRLPGTRLAKGLTFSISFGLLWFMYLLEPLPHGTWQIPQALYYPVVDGVTLGVTGLLLGLLVATDSKEKFAVRFDMGSLVALAIPIAFLAGRLVSYGVFHIYSSFGSRTLDTVLWCTALGLWVAVMYQALRPGLPGNALTKAVFFGVVVFGVNIFLNDLFMPIPFAMPLAGLGAFSYEDMAVRTLMDVISVTVGAYIFEVVRPAMGESGEKAAPASPQGRPMQ